MEWAALIAWIATAGGGFVMLAIWLSRGGMNQAREGGGKATPPNCRVGAAPGRAAGRRGGATRASGL